MLTPYYLICYNTRENVTPKIMDKGEYYGY